MLFFKPSTSDLVKRWLNEAFYKVTCTKDRLKHRQWWGKETLALENVEIWNQIQRVLGWFWYLITNGCFLKFEFLAFLFGLHDSLVASQKHI